MAEQLDGRLKRLEVLRRQQDDVLAAVAGDVNAFVRAVDLVRDLALPGLDLGQRQGRDRAESSSSLVE